MNPASKSSIPKSISHLKVAVKIGRPANPLSKNELEYLISLRALKVPFKECARRLNRTHDSCRRAVQNLNLYGAIEAKRIEIINRETF
jgi:predicted transcriptional regulator